MISVHEDDLPGRRIAPVARRISGKPDPGAYPAVSNYAVDKMKIFVILNTILCLKFKSIRNKEWNMRSRGNVVLIFMLVGVFALTMFGCAKQEGPKDEEAIKAVQAEIEGGAKGYTLKTPIVIVEKGKKLPSGDWPFKVEYTVASADGSTKKEVVSYKLSSSINDMGVTVWTAVESK